MGQKLKGIMYATFFKKVFICFCLHVYAQQLLNCQSIWLLLSVVCVSDFTTGHQVTTKA